ncbi:hypothetical protein JN01_0166 [Entomoplasma freundtii]|uniref:Uncharacterized protein n=1 Tax=Entomoplasma freundtii TaxID=74700 RepID=A0A2K8NTW3_9MOLU|nr:hypothetical protein [Entomoplasma freundtii]ATZ16618.1 hypothetical protein EFREU_v1c05980 [Entomoplasma freundtii]TDY58215.1 hypothetical protein JN01_0166 [Entomoplasma freundtii]
MKILLTSLLGLSLLGAGLTPAVSSLDGNSSDTITKQQVKPQTVQYVFLDKAEYIVNNSDVQINVTFKWNDKVAHPPSRLEFNGDGLSSIVNCGGTIYEHEWRGFPLTIDKFHVLLNEENISGLATQTTTLWFHCGKVESTGDYELTIFYSARTIHSLSDVTGTLYFPLKQIFFFGDTK